MSFDTGTFTADEAGGKIKVCINGEFRYDRTGDFNTLMKEKFAGRRSVPDVEIDLVNCSFLDSGALGTLAQLRKELLNRGAGLRIVNAGIDVLEAMRRIKLDSIIPISGKEE